MGTISQEVQKVGFKAGSFIADIKNNFQSKIEGIVGSVSSQVEGIFSGDVVGIDTKQIPTMIASIDDYVNGLEQQLETMKTNATTDEAFKGSYAGAVADFIAAVKTCCYAVISQLIAFEDNLIEVRDKYTAKDAELQSNISTQASDMAGAYQNYERQKQ